MDWLKKIPVVSSLCSWNQQRNQKQAALRREFIMKALQYSQRGLSNLHLTKFVNNPDAVWRRLTDIVAEMPAEMGQKQWKEYIDYMDQSTKRVSEKHQRVKQRLQSFFKEMIQIARTEEKSVKQSPLRAAQPLRQAAQPPQPSDFKAPQRSESDTQPPRRAAEAPPSSALTTLDNQTQNSTHSYNYNYPDM